LQVLDIYGTILATENPDNELPPRRGFDALVSICKERNVILVTASDANINNHKADLVASGIDLAVFDNFYQLAQLPFKDFGWILQDYQIQPQELLVVGDSDKDIEGARAVGAQFYRVQRFEFYRDYQTIESFDAVTSLLS